MDTNRIIFISWSQPLSLLVGTALKKLIHYVFGRDIPVFLSTGIPKGANPYAIIEQKLKQVSFGIIILTKETCAAPWLVFEMGAMLDVHPVPFLVDCTPADLSGPLSFQQSTSVEKNDIRRLLIAINNKFNASDLSRNSNSFDNLFNQVWPNFFSTYQKIIARKKLLEVLPMEQSTGKLLMELLFQVDEIRRKVLGSEYTNRQDSISNAIVNTDPDNDITIISGATSRHPTLFVEKATESFDVGTKEGREKFLKSMQSELPWLGETDIN